MGKEINRAVNECKKKTEIIMSSNGKKWRWEKSVEQDRVSTSNCNTYVLWQCIYFVVRWNNWIPHVVKHTYYIIVENNQVNERLSTFF
jgi:hypothetical protein